MPGRALIVRLCVCAFAVGVSALLAHVAIDVLGDFFLARDAYDFVPHQSRAAVAVIAMLVFAAGALRLVVAILDAAGGAGEGPSALLRRAIGRRTGFVAAVAVAAIPALAGMEALDVVAAGRPVDDVADLLAGAPLFSIGILAVIAVAVALLVYEAIARLIAAMRAIVGAVAALLALRTPSSSGRAPGTDSGFCQGAANNVLARRGGLRAPPPLLRSCR